MSPRRPEFREETPKEGMCGRSCRTATICLVHRSKSKMFLAAMGTIVGDV